MVYGEPLPKNLYLKTHCGNNAENLLTPLIATSFLLNSTLANFYQTFTIYKRVNRVTRVFTYSTQGK